ncbi:tRNA pseudouridine(38-40) synthase TruA [Campylobacter sp. FMV-PI01]|uniref:tRNA pseudouridine synthase A n=1 Tax=Campylobacter portucalensis TaxID=2608384 RepID=A0A6L5WJD5_9BACT|nr:tRNA pseudouridine(38-40) synthase TruA [Campylobacter portucalensis]MSN97056.1 tRNA pseudouridine(38-40) synthase TruA [Campylobacter portucalensis]
MLIKLTYSFDGSKFCGSQSQPNLKGVEDLLKIALSRVGIFNKIISASRTDKGVHSLNSISVVKCPDFWDLLRLKELLNRHTKPFLYIKKIEIADENFHPRFDAKARSYRYILNHGKFSPFLSNFCYFYKDIDINLLNYSLKKFEGYNDFGKFMKVGSDTKNFKRDMIKAYSFKYKNFTIIKFKANGFLRSQVRLMVANALKEYDYLVNLDLNLLNNKNFIINNSKIFNINQPITKIPAPPQALYLERIFYY